MEYRAFHPCWGRKFAWFTAAEAPFLRGCDASLAFFANEAVHRRCLCDCVVHGGVDVQRDVHISELRLCLVAREEAFCAVACLYLMRREREEREECEEYPLQAKMCVDEVDLVLSRGGCYTHLDDRELFFALCGVLHQEPFRFATTRAIHHAMGECWGDLSLEERQRFQPDGKEWIELREQNARHVLSGRIVKSAQPFRVAKSRYESWVRQHDRELLSKVHSFVQEKITTGLFNCAPQIGQPVLKALGDAFNLDGPAVQGVRRSYNVFRGRRWHLASVGKATYSLSLQRQSKPPHEMHPIPAPPTILYVGQEAVDRVCLVTMAMIPVDWDEDDVRAMLRDRQLPTPAAVARTHVAADGKTCSWRVAFETEDGARALMDTHLVLEREEDGKERAICRWHHVHDYDEWHHGSGADVVSLMNKMVERNALEKERNMIVVTWSDGIVLHGSHFTTGVSFLIGSRGCTPAQRYFHLHGSDSDAILVGGLDSFLLALCSASSSRVVFSVRVEDHGMAFVTTGVRTGGKVGNRSPYVKIPGESFPRLLLPSLLTVTYVCR